VRALVDELLACRDGNNVSSFSFAKTIYWLGSLPPVGAYEARQETSAHRAARYLMAVKPLFAKIRDKTFATTESLTSVE